MPRNTYGSRRCRAHRQGGEPCGQWAIRGGTVCITHGGLAPQVKAKAEERLQALVHPAITGLAELINNADSDSVRLSAIRDLLDRTGYKPTERIQAEQEVVIRVLREEQPISIELEHALGNGRTHD